MLIHGLNKFWVVSVSTDRLLVQADFCQVYFKLSQISVLCQSDFSPAQASYSQVFSSSEFQSVFMADAHTSFIGADNGDPCF